MGAWPLFLLSGKCTGGPDSKDIACYQVLVMGDKVHIKPRKPGEAGFKVLTGRFFSARKPNVRP